MKLCINYLKLCVLICIVGHYWLLKQFRSRLISQLIKCISRALQKLLKYFNGFIISIFFVPSFSDLPVIFSFILNKSVEALFALKSVIVLLTAKSSFYNIAIKFQFFFNDYRYILLNYALALLH